MFQSALRGNLSRYLKNQLTDIISYSVIHLAYSEYYVSVGL